MSKKAKQPDEEIKAASAAPPPASLPVLHVPQHGHASPDRAMAQAASVVAHAVHLAQSPSKRTKAADQETKGRQLDVVLCIDNINITKVPLSCLSTGASLVLSCSSESKFEYRTHPKGGIGHKGSSFDFDVGLPFFVKAENLKIRMLVKEGITSKTIADVQWDIDKLVEKSNGQFYNQLGWIQFEGGHTSTYSAVFHTEMWDPVYRIPPDGSEADIAEDSWTALVVGQVRRQLQYPPITDAVLLPLPPDNGPIEMTTVPGMTVKCAASDPHLPLPPGAGQILTFLNEILPFEDNPGPFPSRRIGRAWLTKFTENLWPNPKEGTWMDVTSDACFRQYCFYNAGEEFIRRVPGGYLIDMTLMEPFETRAKWERYGGKAFFDDHGRPIKIECKVGGIRVAPTTFTPDMGTDWEYAKLRIRTGLFAWAAAVHLCVGHMRWGSEPQIGTRTNLDHNHPVNRLLAPHFFRAHLVVAKSLRSLTPERGMLHRATAFTGKDLAGFFQYCYDHFEYKSWEQTVEERGMHEAPDTLYPSYTDGLELNNIINTYCDTYLRVYYHTDQDVQRDPQLTSYWAYMKSVWKDLPPLNLQTLIDYCKNVIFYNSAWHEQIGNVSGYARDPAAVALQIPFGEKPLMGTPQSNLIVAYLTIMTQERTPRLSQNWKHFFLDERAKMIWADFNAALNGLAANIHARNQRREFKILDYDPNYVKLSISS